MAKVRGGVDAVMVVDWDCDSVDGRELERGFGRGKMIVRNKGGLFGFVWWGSSSGREMWMARYQMEDFLERFSMVVVFARASWIDDADMPIEKREKRIALVELVGGSKTGKCEHTSPLLGPSERYSYLSIILLASWQRMRQM